MFAPARPDGSGGGAVFIAPGSAGDGCMHRRVRHHAPCDRGHMATPLTPTVIPQQIQRDVSSGIDALSAKVARDLENSACNVGMQTIPPKIYHIGFNAPLREGSTLNSRRKLATSRTAQATPISKRFRRRTTTADSTRRFERCRAQSTKEARNLLKPHSDKESEGFPLPTFLFRLSSSDLPLPTCLFSMI